MDGSCTCDTQENQKILAAARCIRFFPGSICSSISGVRRDYYVDIGKLIDLLVSYNYRFGANAFEAGYNASFLTSASIEPSIEILEGQLNFIRSNFFVSYKHVFLQNMHPHGIIFALSYGFDNRPKIFRNIVTVWGAWGISF